MSKTWLSFRKRFEKIEKKCEQAYCLAKKAFDLASSGGGGTSGPVEEHLLAGGRFTLNNGAWVAMNTSYGYSNFTFSTARGSGVAPTTDSRDIGFGFFPVGTILHRIEFSGFYADDEVENIEVFLAEQGANLTTTGYNRNLGAGFYQQIPLPSDTIDFPTIGAANGDTFSHVSFDLGDHEILNEGRMILIYVKPIGTLTGTRFWYTDMKLYYTRPQN